MTARLKLPNNWFEDDIRELLHELEQGEITLVSDPRLGIPTIHDYGKHAVHCGFGVFKLETSKYTIQFCGGGALHRTASQKGFSFVTVTKGEFPYNAEAIKETLRAYLPGEDET